MKKLFMLAIMAIAISFVSCQKDTNDTSNPYWKTSITQYVNSQVNSNPKTPTTQDKKVSGTIGADVAGAVQGAAAGSAWGWPGMVIGAIIGGVGSSVAYWNSIPRVDVVPPIDPSVYPSTTNERSYMGTYHNVICFNAIQDSSIFTNGELNQNYMNFVRPYVEQMITKNHPEIPLPLYLGDFNDYSVMFNNIKTSVENEDYNSIQIDNNNLKFFYNEFMRGLQYCKTKQEVEAYVNGFERCILNSTIEDEIKLPIMSALSIANNSNNLWN
jgi:hypothetical protein